MWQVLGLGLYLSGLAGLQLLWPFALPGLNTAPALVLVAGALGLYYAPRLGLYAWLLVLAAGFDLLYAAGLFCLPAYALACQIPFWLRQQSETPGVLRPLLMLTLTLLVFEALMTLFSLRAGYAGLAFGLRSLGPWMLFNLLSALLLWPVTYALVRALHYQRFEYRDEVVKGYLG